MHIQLRKFLSEDLKEAGFVRRSQDLNEICNPYQAAASLLEDKIFKKLVTAKHKDSKQRAIEKWLECNEICARGFVPPKLDSDLALAYGLAKDFARSLLLDLRNGSSCELREPISNYDGSFGPGCTLLAENESQACKFAFCVHTASSHKNRAFYRSSLLGNPRAWALEQSRETEYGFQIVRASKLTTVNKENDIDRVICIEPLLNLFRQQAIRAFLERRLRTINIDFKVQQEIHRLMARRGSLDGSLCTLDLSSASDTISLNFCKDFLPEALLEELLCARSPYVKIGDEEVEVHMISSMGNATTFPLQTIIFFCLTIGTMMAHNLSPHKRGKRSIVPSLSGPDRNIGVFGDDMICPTECADDLMRLLGVCGFTVNTRKSYYSGHFRESCGGNYLRGVDVTPVRCETLSGRSDIFSLYNRLMVWGVLHKSPLVRTLDYLHSRVDKPLYVPFDEDVSAGFFKVMGARWYRALVDRQRKARVKTLHGVALFLAASITQHSDGSCWAPLRGSAGTRAERRFFPGFLRKNDWLLATNQLPRQPDCSPGKRVNYDLLLTNPNHISLWYENLV